MVVGRAGGLLRELPRAGLAAEEAVVAGRDPVESRGAADLVAGLAGGVAVFVLRVEASSAAPREAACLSMMMTTAAGGRKV